MKVAQGVKKELNEWVKLHEAFVKAVQVCQYCGEVYWDRHDECPHLIKLGLNGRMAYKYTLKGIVEVEKLS